MFLDVAVACVGGAGYHACAYEPGLIVRIADAQTSQTFHPASLAERGEMKGMTRQDLRKYTLREVIPHKLESMPQLLRHVHVRQDHTYDARSEEHLADGAVALGMGEEEGRETPVFVQVGHEGEESPRDLSEL